MFTGIVEELGEVVALDLRGADSEDAEPGDTDPRDAEPADGRSGGSARLTVRGELVTSDARHGDSIAVNGVCLTVAAVDGAEFTADVMKETLDRSSLGALRPGSPVNLERAVRADQRLGGHIVQGHVDGTGVILSREPGPDWEIVRLSLPADLGRYVVEKGSIAVDGVSLTVVEVDADRFSVSLIPTTLELTTLGRKQPGDPVNLEVDVIAKYVEKLTAGTRA